MVWKCSSQALTRLNSLKLEQRLGSVSCCQPDVCRHVLCSEVNGATLDSFEKCNGRYIEPVRFCYMKFRRCTQDVSTAVLCAFGVRMFHVMMP